MEMGKEPVIFENPMYSARGTVVKVVLPAKVRLHPYHPSFWLLLLLDVTLLGLSQEGTPGFPLREPQCPLCH